MDKALIILLMKFNCKFSFMGGGIMMYLASIGDLKEGDILAKNIYTSDGKLLLGAGRRLNKKYINKLDKVGINHIYLKDNRLKELKKEDIEIIPEEIRKEAIIIARDCIKKIIDADTGLNHQEKHQLYRIIADIIDTITINKKILNCIKDIRLLQDELFFHLTNVTVLSLVVGKQLGYEKERLMELGIGAFLHDVGKIKVPLEIINKPGRLTDEEFEEVKKHTTYGYQILGNIEGIPEVSARIAYLHHERCDGSGYPKGISRRYIDEYARIVAIADVFDSMINDRVYRSSIKVKEVIEYLYTTFTENKMDRELVERFLRMVTPYPIGTKVKLNIGCEAVVTRVNETMKLRPVVKVLNFSGLDRDFIIDLSKDLNIDIIEEIV
jgi:HD-GYP domain-containing protein (c-di-GMP phosphodiesterase class II)